MVVLPGADGPQPVTTSFYLVYLALCLTPVILDRREARAWRCSPSKT